MRDIYRDASCYERDMQGTGLPQNTDSVLGGPRSNGRFGSISRSPILEAPSCANDL